MRGRSGARRRWVAALSVVLVGGCDDAGDTTSTTNATTPAGTVPVATASSAPLTTPTLAPNTTEQFTTTELSSEEPASSPSSTPPPTGPGVATLCADNEQVAYVAFDKSIGTELWHTCTQDSNDYRSPVAATDSLLYALEIPQQTGPRVPTPLVAYSAADGTEVWRVALSSSGPGLPAAGAIVGGGVIVAVVDNGSGGGDLAGIDATTGAVLWRTAEDRLATLIAGTDTVVVGRSAFAPPAPGTVTSQPSTEPPSSTMWSIDRVTGNRLWETEVPLGQQLGPFETATIDGDAVITSDGPAKYDIATGEVVWSGGDPIEGAIGGSGDGIFVTGGQDDPTSGHDAATGDSVWTNDGRVAYDNVWAIGDGAVYVIGGDRSALTAYELATGDVRWTAPWDQERYSWPFHATDDTLYLMWTNIDAVATADGTPLWSTSYTPDQDHRFAGAVSNTTALITAINGASGGD